MCNPPCWPGRAEPSRAGPEPSQAEPNRAEPGRAKPGQAEPSRAAMSRAEPSRAKEGYFSPLCLSPCSGSIYTSLSMLHAGGVSLGVGVYSPQKGNAFKIVRKWGGSLETAPVRGKLKGHVKGMCKLRFWDIFCMWDIPRRFVISSFSKMSTSGKQWWETKFQNKQLENNSSKFKRRLVAWGGWVAWILTESPICKKHPFTHPHVKSMV